MAQSSSSPSTGAAADPQSGGPASAPVGPSGLAPAGDLQAVVNEITRLRDDVRVVGEGITKLRDEVRADISRLEGKMQALEPRRAGQGPNRTEVGSAPPPATLRRGASRPDRSRATDREAREPETVSAGSPDARSRALRRLPSRDRLAVQARPASELRARSGTPAARPTGSAPAPERTFGEATKISREAAQAAPSSIRGRIRRSGANTQASRAERGATRPPSAAAGSARDRFVDLSTVRRRSSDPRYASFRPVEAAPGRPSAFRSVRRSLRYRPIAECIP